MSLLSYYFLQLASMTLVLSLRFHTWRAHSAILKSNSRNALRIWDESH